MSTPGRSCPLSYRHGPEALVTAPRRRAAVAWVAGGLYGNVEALDALLERLAGDPAGGGVCLVFNGDFHWFDTDPDDFRHVQDMVLQHEALAGNVEAELAEPHAGAGCGCAYPDFVDDATVARSNRIIERLCTTAGAIDGASAALGRLPRLLRLEVADRVIGVVHGDPESLAGWGFAVEHLAARGGPTDAATVGDWARRARVDAFACSHTCLPWAASLGGVAVINNGSAGMPNFRGRRQGLVTRIAAASDPAPDALYAVTAGGVRLEAVPIAYDHAAWQRRFLRAWPQGTPAHASYYRRIVDGPAFEPGDARPAAARGQPARRP